MPVKDKPQPNVWDTWDDARLEDAIGEIADLRINSGHMLMMEVLEIERKKLAEDVAYIVGHDELRIHQGYMQMMDRLLTLRSDLHKILVGVQRARSAPTDDEAEKLRPLDNMGL